MAMIGWPNEAAPGLATFRLAVPDDWTAVEPPEGLLALLGPERDGFRPNVVIFGRRVDADVPVAEIADQTVVDNSALVVGDGSNRPASETELAIAVRRGSAVIDETEVSHLIVATAADDLSPAGLRSLYVLMGTFLSTRTADDEPAVKEIISSFTVVGTDR